MKYFYNFLIGDDDINTMQSYLKWDARYRQLYVQYKLKNQPLWKDIPYLLFFFLLMIAGIWLPVTSLGD